MSNRVGPAASGPAAWTVTAVGLALTATVGTGCWATAIAAPAPTATIAPSIAAFALRTAPPLVWDIIRPRPGPNVQPRPPAMTAPRCATAAGHERRHRHQQTGPLHSLEITPAPDEAVAQVEIAARPGNPAVSRGRLDPRPA